jgi:hypothetical protein
LRVEARQNGGQFVVSFEVPELRGEGDPFAIDRAELLRVAYGSGGAPPADPDAFRRRGEIVARLRDGGLAPTRVCRIVDRPSPAAGIVAQGATIRYGVRLVDRRGRMSPVATAPEVVAADPVPGPTGLGGEPTADGVRLAWDAEPGRAYNVYRSAIGEELPLRPIHDRPVPRGEFLDVDAPTGARHVYTVRVALGEAPPFVEGEDSEPVEIVAEDRFPPGAPRGLVAVQEGSAVRLFWDPNPERDVGGYRVYRHSGNEDWVRIGPDPVDRPLYRDESIEAGRIATYRVTAVDRATPPNEGEPSPSVEIAVAAEAGAPEGPDP